MAEQDFKTRLDELDRLLNDADAPIQPARVWTLLAEVAAWDVPALAPPGPPSDKMTARA